MSYDLDAPKLGCESERHDLFALWQKQICYSRANGLQLTSSLLRLLLNPFHEISAGHLRLMKALLSCSIFSLAVFSSFCSN